MSVLIDMIGQKFNRLYVISRAENCGQGKAYWNCKCECGNLRKVNGHKLRSGLTKSCGCWDIESIIKRNTKHGKSVRGKISSEYRIWSDIKKRCLNPNSWAFEHYGGRGITLCKRWLKFENFYADMGDRPSKLHTVERNNNDLGYSPENCRWATRAEQNRNTRQNRWITIEDQTLCLADWVSKNGITRGAFYCRLNRGWSIEKAITTPIKRKP